MRLTSAAPAPLYFAPTGSLASGVPLKRKSPMTTRTTTINTLIAAAAGVALALAAPVAASAHVSVSPNDAEAGAYSSFQFKAPNESASAKTIRLEVTLPRDTPIASVSYQPTPGWTTEVITETLPKPVTIGDNEITEAAARIVFTADAGGGIAPGQFQLWTVSFGPIPEVGSLVFPAVQTYDDGEVANWTATPDEAEADSTLKPAPVVFVGDEPVSGGHGHGGSADAETATDAHDADAEAPVTAGADTGLALGLSIAALVLAALGAGLGAFSVFGRRSARSRR